MSETPDQFRELAHVRQHTDEPKRRWFVAPGMDLIAWVDEYERPFKFQLWYAKRPTEFALTWESGRGFNHAEVDGGEARPAASMTPILNNDDAPFDQSYLLELFQASHATLPTDIGSMVLEALQRYPSSPAVAGRRPASRAG